MKDAKYRCPGCRRHIEPAPFPRRGPHRCPECGRSSWRLINGYGRKVLA